MLRSDGAYLPRGQRAARAGEVVAHGAVDAEQLTAAGDIGVRARGVLAVRDGGSRGQGRHVGGHRSDLLVGELDVLLAGRLHAGHRQRHPAGAHLEVDRRRADAGEAGAAGGALGAEPVTGGAVGLEELLALLDLVGADGGGRGRLRCQGGIGRSGHHEPCQEEEGDGGRVPAAGGQCVHSALLSVCCRRGIRGRGVVWMGLTAAGRWSRTARSTRHRRSASSTRSPPRPQPGCGCTSGW